MQDAHDPASYLRSEIAAYDAGLRPNWEAWQRERYFEVVLDGKGDRLRRRERNTDTTTARCSYEANDSPELTGDTVRRAFSKAHRN